MWTTNEDSKDNGKWVLEDDADNAIDFKNKLIWTKRGFLWAYMLSECQRKVAYRRIFLKESIKSISDDLNITESTVRQHWLRAVKKAVELMDSGI